jgi:hypothetical protein
MAFKIDDSVFVISGAQTYVGKINSIQQFGSVKEENFRFAIQLEYRSIIVYGWALKPIKIKDESDDFKRIFLQHKFRGIRSAKFNSKARYGV